MCHACNEKKQTTPDGGNVTTKSRQDFNTWRKVSLKYICILEANAIKLGELDSYAETLKRNKYPGCNPC